ncbi:MAG: D-mannonate epimerase, partial [Planctomycetales bacterium]|nr:D-mannonate epimerase [Planctomycetales bacterium]NIM09354.1 D-mannonate epimerase [Planctomycetales bacterium]NIN08821.1 D-mannonate epimerase [Planctomycetales bacterium]NIN77938.1 D-mannonate epimerase [Planctomycetales bacterium]NIO35121.1 D-mannonate epimerase [Planctomycetales bacterium]
MALYFAQGRPDTELSDEDLQAGLAHCFDQLGPRQRVLAVPPDFTRAASQAGRLTCLAYHYYGDRLVDVLPALGTHFPMQPWQLDRMFPRLPLSLIRQHDWRHDVVTLGEVPASFVAEATGGRFDQPWTAQMNRLVCQGGHDLILSLGQVVPHEVIGMANYNKNLFIGTGGPLGINTSHFISAACGIERTLGQIDTPVRRILNRAEQLFCGNLPVVYVLTVIGRTTDNRLAVRGLFVGDDSECFQQAAELSVQVNIEILDEMPQTVVAYLDPTEFHSTWLGNKAIYRTRMAIADGGQLIVLAGGVRTCGEDPRIDRLIRQYGYRTTDEVLQFVAEDEQLRQNLSAAAHLIHGSPENRFRVTYCPGHLSREEIEGVGYEYADLATMQSRYDPAKLMEGWNDLPDGQRIYYVSKPALGLWTHRSRL